MVYFGNQLVGQVGGAGCTDNEQEIGLPTGVPGRVVLHQNTPNPFNPVTKIRFSLPQRSQVELKIYDIAGREVKTLVSGELDSSNNHEYSWFGKDDSGDEVGSGVYFYRLNAGKDSTSKVRGWYCGSGFREYR